jgi:hypothetical protein
MGRTVPPRLSRRRPRALTCSSVRSTPELRRGLDLRGGERESVLAHADLAVDELDLVDHARSDEPLVLLDRHVDEYRRCRGPSRAGVALGRSATLASGAVESAVLRRLLATTSPRIGLSAFSEQVPGARPSSPLTAQRLREQLGADGAAVPLSASSSPAGRPHASGLAQHTEAARPRPASAPQPRTTPGRSPSFVPRTRQPRDACRRLFK